MLHVRGGRRGSGAIMLISSNEYSRYKPPQTKVDYTSDCASTNMSWSTTKH